MTTFSYEILQLVCEQKIDNQPDAVSGVQIRLTAERDGQTRSSVVFVPLAVNYDNSNFIAYDQLNDGIVRTWITAETAIMNEYKTSLEVMLGEVVDPVTINRTPPWVTTSATPVSDPAYKQLRRTSYPRIGDQLDMLWHAMDSGEVAKATGFYDAIKAIKDQYPKS